MNLNVNEIPVWFALLAGVVGWIANVAIKNYKLEKFEKELNAIKDRQNAFETHVETMINLERTAVNTKLDVIIGDMGNLRVGIAEVKVKLDERTRKP